MAQDRKFVRNLTGPGSAAQIREHVSSAMRESTCLSKPQLVEPLDYETVIVKNRTLLDNDPHREMLLFPPDDVRQSTCPRKLRTVRCSVPQQAIKDASGLLVKECIKTYTSNWNVIHYQYSAYGGSFLHLPRVSKPGILPDHLFEVDAEADGKDEEASNRMRPMHITRQGWLYKGPDSGQESSIISFTRSFKRRYFYLKQQADTTYILEFHKDDKKLEAKGSIFLDSAVNVIRSSRRGKHAFELYMQNKSFYLFSADSEVEMDEWVMTLKKVISSNDSVSLSSMSDRMSVGRDSDISPSKSENYIESLESSMNPELQKYARETDSTLSKARRENRQKLFSIFPDIQRAQQHDVDGEENKVFNFREQFGTRIIVKCDEFKLRLQANLGEDTGMEKLSNPEPFFITLALYDAQKGEKISEDFHFDPNSDDIRSMIPQELLMASDMLNSVDGITGKMPDLHGLDEQWLKYPNLGIFSVMKPNREIYLVAKIEKVLQGGLNAAAEPYTRTPDIRSGTKIYRQMKTYCSRLGHYRMPFAWGARPVFKSHTLELDTYSDFALYKQDPAKVSEEDIIKNLQDIRKPEKQGKWTSILGTLKVSLYNFKSQLQNSVTSSLVPVKPFPDLPESSPAREVEEFVPETGECASPYVTYTNNLYVCPRVLKYDGQKSFTKARNIACYIEIRDSDNEGTVPLKCIYGRPGGSMFTTCATCAVLHHSTSPEFMEEIKLALPAQLNDKHHVVFTFYHVSCELPKTTSSKTASKKAHNIETPIGYAWFPLLIQGRVNVGEQSRGVAINLPAGYLTHEQLGLGRGSTGPDIKWVDGGRPLFKFFIRLVSTSYTKDQHLHNFFSHCQKMDSPSSMAAVDFETSNRLKPAEGAVAHGTPPSSKDSPYDQDMKKFIKSLHAVDPSTLISFMPTLFNQLFRLLPHTHSEDVAMNAVRVLIHVVYQIHDVGKPEFLHSYVKYVFVTEPAASSKEKTVHEELAKHLKGILRPTQGDQLVTARFMKHSSFFFEILVKSMAQHLLCTDRIKMSRNERFPSSFQFHVQTLVSSLVSHIVQKFKDNLEETKNANVSLANFIRRCFTFMDRGFVFRLINMYIDNFSPGDPKILHEYKFEFLRIVCSHEHFIPLNLPMVRKRIKNYKDLKHDYTLSDEFRRDHFLVGLLLHEVKMALNEIRDIRKSAILTLRNLLAKHSFDDRYSKGAQARIAMLYLPFITVILENQHRLTLKDSIQTTPIGAAPPQVPNGDIPAMPDTPVKANAPYNSLPSYSSNLSLSEQPAKPRLPDPSVLAMISGQGPPSMSNLNPMVPDLKPAHHGSSSSLASSASSSQSTANSASEKDKDREKDGRDQRDSIKVMSPTHQRTQSTASQIVGNNPFMVRYDKLDQHEIKDLLICFQYIVKNLSEEVLLGWFNNSSETDVLDFLSVLEICMQHFKYLGKKRITSLCIISDSRHGTTVSHRASTSIIGDTKRAMTLPTKKGQSLQAYSRSSSASYNMENGDGGGLHTAGSFHSMHTSRKDKDKEETAPSQSEADAMYRAMLEANLSSEVAMVVLDVVGLYTTNFKDQLQFREGDNNIMQKIFDLYLQFMQTSQSEVVQKHAFAALRSFINKFPKVLFKGEANMCGRLCYEILRCCNSRLNSTRSEACALMYLLMRSNFEYSKRKSFTRVHLQMIISVSQLISDVVGLSNSRFTDSLSIINSYANSDKAMQRSVFPVDVKDLTKRIRTVLMATAQMKEHQNDPEMLVDLQYSLAKSYASTPELRKTWLDSMARIHTKHNNYSEAAHCYIHIAALVAEYLRRRGVFPQGCSAFKGISPNVEAEEAGMRDDSGMQDVEYTEDHLVDLLEHCAALMEQAERYELLGEIYRLVIPIYERKRDFESLSLVYERLQKSYAKIVDVMQSGKRLLGKYFRVAFFGQNFFEEEDGKEYIYKEPKITGLTEICDRLKNMYTEKFGKGTVKLIMDSNKVNPNDLDSKFAYVQVTYVTPYFEEKELTERVTTFERNNNIRRFMFETPFTKNGKPRGEIDEQYKRRTILTTSHSFPYVKKRILVVYHKEEELTPIEVAIDEMRNKVKDLHEVIGQDLPDMKKLQLRLQGSVSVQVNAGPLAYAEAFLAEGKVQKYNREKVAALKDTFRAFVRVCDSGLMLNGRLVSTEQLEYHDALKTNFYELTERLSDMFGEMLLEDDNRSIHSHRSSVTVFSVISATTGNTSSV